MNVVRMTGNWPEFLTKLLLKPTQHKEKSRREQKHTVKTDTAFERSNPFAIYNLHESSEVYKSGNKLSKKYFASRHLGPLFWKERKKIPSS